MIIGGTDTVKKSIGRFELYKAGKEFGTVGHLMVNFKIFLFGNECV